MLAKLQESSETIAALNAQLEDEASTTTVPIQRFNAIRDTLTDDQRNLIDNNEVVAMVRGASLLDCGLVLPKV